MRINIADIIVSHKELKEMVGEIIGINIGEERKEERKMVRNMVEKLYDDLTNCMLCPVTIGK